MRKSTGEPFTGLTGSHWALHGSLGLLAKALGQKRQSCEQKPRDDEQLAGTRHFMDGEGVFFSVTATSLPCRVISHQS